MSKGRLTLSATGVAGTALFLVVMFLPNLPMYGDSMVEYGRWAQTHNAAARFEVGLLTLTYVIYLVFGIYFAALVRGGDALSTLLAQVALVAVGSRFAIEVIQVSVLLVPATGTTQDFGGAVAQLGSVLSGASLMPHTVFLLAARAAALSSRSIPAWLGWYTVAIGAIHVLAMLFGFSGINPGPAAAAFGFLWFASIPAWPLVAGVALMVPALRRPGMSLAPAPTS